MLVSRSHACDIYQYARVRLMKNGFLVIVQEGEKYWGSIVMTSVCFRELLKTGAKYLLLFAFVIVIKY